MLKAIITHLRVIRHRYLWHAAAGVGGLMSAQSVANFPGRVLEVFICEARTGMRDDTTGRVSNERMHTIEARLRV